MDKQKKTTSTILHGIATVMLICMCTIHVMGCGTSLVEEKPERGIITDRNGQPLVVNDTVEQSESTGFTIVRRYIHPVAAQLLGYIELDTPTDTNNGGANDEGEVIGRAGVEKYYDKALKGENGTAGKNLKLTIDYELQKLGEELMKDKSGSIVAIEPSTGEVLCMVSTPSYDPQLLLGNETMSNLHSLQQDSLKPLTNRCIMELYTPGGVFRGAQGLVLLSEDIVTPQSTYPCDTEFLPSKKLRWLHRHEVPVTLAEALRTSCNGYFCHGYLDMMNNGKYGTVKKALEKWREYMISFGLGQQLGIDLPNEKRGVIPNADYYDKKHKMQWSGKNTLDIAMGQGEISTTPLQLANLSAIIANRGYYYIPHVVKEIEGDTIDGKYTIRQSTKASKDACEAVANGMRQSAVSGTCKDLSKLMVEACGISGVLPSKSNNHSAFIGFAPIDNPKIAIAVYVENDAPTPRTAVTVGGKMIEMYLNKYNQE